MAGERILVVDDKPESVELLTEYLLRPNDYVPLVARDGDEGLQAALAEQPDLIILDQRMPKMSGLQVLRVLRERSIDTPVILMTAYGAESVIVEALRLGVCDYINKPYDIDEMLGAIEKGLQTRRDQRKRDRAWEELQDRIKRLGSLYTLSTDKILSLVVESAAQVTGAEEAYLLLLDESTNELYLRAEKNLNDEIVRGLRMRVDDSLAGRVIQTRHPVFFNPVEAEQRFKIKTGYFVHSLINVPIQVGARVIGVLGVANRSGPGLFSRVDVEVLVSLADYAAIGLENTRLFGEVRSALGQRMMELAAIQTLDREFSRTPGADLISDLVLSQIMQTTQAEAGLIGLLREGKRVWAFSGYLKELPDREAVQRWDAGIIGRVVRTGQSALVPDVSADPDWDGVPAQTESVLVVPVMQKGRVIGVVCLQSSQQRAFDESNLRFVTGVSDHMVVALENARLWNAIMERERKMEMILSSMADGVYTVDPDLRIVSWNQAAERITGWSQAEAVGRFSSELLYPRDMEGELSCEEDRLLKKAVETGASPAFGSVERTIVHRDGHQVLISCSVAPLLDSAGNVVGGVSVFRDVSSERMLERAKGEFIAMVSHQLRSPLTSIITSADLLADPGLPGDLQAEMVQMVRSQSEVLSRFVDDIVNVVELESGKGAAGRQPVLLEDVVPQVLRLFKARNADREFQHHLPEALPPVCGDAKRISIILKNLVDNAVKYSAKEMPVSVQVIAEQEGAVVQVIDRGIGIPPEQLENLFQRFYRADGSDTQRVYGVGLGLYVAKKLVELLGGRIWAQSQVGKGSCFSFSLPWWKEDPETPVF